MNRELIKKIYPFGITAGVVILDQVLKLVVAATMHPGDSIPVLGDFFKFSFVYNKNAIFGLGENLPEFLRPVVMLIFPVLGMILLAVYFFKSRTLTTAYRLPLAGILGGGLGNIIDRAFRPDGVVDFLDFDFFNIHFAGIDIKRFPTFNIADTAVTVSVIAIGVLFIYDEYRERKKKEI